MSDPRPSPGHQLQGPEPPDFPLAGAPVMPPAHGDRAVQGGCQASGRAGSRKLALLGVLALLGALLLVVLLLVLRAR